LKCRAWRLAKAALESALPQYGRLYAASFGFHSPREASFDRGGPETAHGEAPALMGPIWRHRAKSAALATLKEKPDAQEQIQAEAIAATRLFERIMLKSAEKRQARINEA
jgi:hypothetical protein